MKTIVIIISGLILIHFLRSPSEWERMEAQRQRVVNEEKELMTRNILMVRQDINLKLHEIKNERILDERSRKDLETLLTSLEDENKRIRTSMQDISAYDAWIKIKQRAIVKLTGVKAEFKRVKARMEKSMRTRETELTSLSSQ